MKVQIKENRSGKIKLVDKRFADILINAKFASYHTDEASTYETKVITPSSLQEPESKEVDTRNEIDNNKPKRGRRKKTYETKVMTPEE